HPRQQLYRRNRAGVDDPPGVPCPLGETRLVRDPALPCARAATEELTMLTNRPKPETLHGDRLVWRWEKHSALAYTKSEARAEFKRKPGLKRLPIGANVVRQPA